MRNKYVTVELELPVKRPTIKEALTKYRMMDMTIEDLIKEKIKEAKTETERLKLKRTLYRLAGTL